MMKMIFMGCVEFSDAALRKVLELRNRGIEVAGVITRRYSSAHSDFKSLEPMAKDSRIPCLLADDASESQTANWIRSTSPDVIYCFGWSQLLGKEILAASRLGVIGYHPAALPQNRGRHPIIWTLALGLRQTASTFFFMDEGADSGDILSQRKVSISDQEDAGTLYQKLIDTAMVQIEEFTMQLVSGRYPREKQNHAEANVWRKRSKEDGRIDWRMNAQSVCNLVRALARPYPGAYFLYQKEEISVWKAEKIPVEERNIEPGKILAVENRTLIVKCGEDAVRLVEHGFQRLPQKGEYL